MTFYTNPTSSISHPFKINFDDETLFSKIAQENLKTLVSINLTQTPGMCNFDEEFESSPTALFKRKLSKALNPEPEQLRRLIFQILSNYESSSLASESEEVEPFEKETDIIDQTTWKDLELLCGAQSEPRLFLANCIDRCVTDVSRCLLYRKIVQPTDNVATLENQREIIRELATNKDLFDEIDQIFKDLQISENALLSLWDNDDVFNLIIQQGRIRPPFENKISIVHRMADALNKNATVLECREIKDKFFKLMGMGFITYALVEIPYNMITGRNLFPSLSRGNFLRSMRPVTAVGVAVSLAHLILPDVKSRVISSVLAEFQYSRNAFSFIRMWENESIIEECMRKKLHYIAIYFSIITKINNILNKFTQFADRLPRINKFCKKWENLKTNQKDLFDLFAKLLTPFFLEDKTLFMSHNGNVMATYYHLLHINKKPLVEAMIIIGELGAQFSIAKTFKEFNKNNKVRFCFPKYLKSNNEQPIIEAQDFWSTLINTDKVVLNSLRMGTDLEYPRNVIVTGPNAGGKSTIIKSLIQSIIMAQSLGIAPAASLSFSPFSKIISYLNVTDDIAAGNSYFKACVVRAQEILSFAKLLQNHKYVLAAVDELFNGTNPEEGSIAALKFLSLLGSMSKCMCITSTHFKSLTNLGNSMSKIFKNYKVAVIELPNGEGFKYPYLLEPGISSQIIAIKMVAYELGYSLDSFLDA